MSFKQYVKVRLAGKLLVVNFYLEYMEEDNLFKEIEKEFEAMDELSELPELLKNEIDIEEIQNRLKPILVDELNQLKADRSQVRNIDSTVQNIIDEVFEVLESDEQELENYFESRGLNEEEREEVAEKLLNWLIILKLFSETGERYADEDLVEKLESIMRKAYTIDDEKFFEVMKKPIESREFITGYQNAFANTDFSGQISKDDKYKMMEVIQNTYEFGLEESMILISQLLSIIQDKSLNVTNAGDVKDRIDGSEYPELWNDEFRKIRHSATHNRYTPYEDKIEMWDRKGEWEETYTDKELEKKLVEIIKKMRNTLYSMSVAVGNLEVIDSSDEEIIDFTNALMDAVDNRN